MTDNVLRFAIFGNNYQPQKSPFSQQILHSLRRRKAVIAIERGYYDFLSTTLHTDCTGATVFDGSDFEADYVISMGGDGTLLRAASYVGEKQTPIIGFNMGRLGFLAQVAPDETEAFFDELWQGQYATDEHAMITVMADGRPLSDFPVALNDIAVLKRDTASMISIEAHVNGEFLATYMADGLIISTPTGSTAYSLSNGGPVIVPKSGILCLPPVAPHSLNIRPIVISDDAEITLKVVSRSHHFLAAIDGRSEKVAEGTTLSIRKAPYSTRIIRRSNHDYFSTLRAKMMWGADQRL